MLVYDSESNLCFWDENFDFTEGGEESPYFDATEILWAVVVARDSGVSIPDVERHLQYLRDIGADDLPVEDLQNPYWSGL